MDGLVCPRLAGFLRLTQKLKAKIQNKKDSGKDLCPICGRKSNKGNLCQECFMRSFRPIAYTRNIKVVEQKEFFYGPGKDGRWRCKKRAEATCGRYETKDEIGKEVLNVVVSSTKTLGNLLGSSDNTENSGECNSDNGIVSDDERLHILTDPPQPAIPVFDQEFKTVELIPSSELVKVDLTDVNTTTQTEEEAMEPLPKFVPDFWESPTEDISHSMASKLRTFTDHVIKEAQRPFKEIFCDSSTNIISPGDDRQEHEGSNTNFSAEMYKNVLHKVQRKLSKPHLNVCCPSVETDTRRISVAPDEVNLTFSKKLKQNAILELLKVAFKTNMILNSLFQYFKKVVESDGSNSDNSECDQKLELGNENIAADSKISVDSFLFPNRQSAILWGIKSGMQHESKAGIAGGPNAPLDGEHISDTEVISKSQATLSMLLNRTPWSPFDGEVPSINEEYQGDVIGPCPGKRSILTSPSDSPVDKFVTRKFHSEHSKLRLKHRQDNESREDLSCASSDLEFQPSSNTVVSGTAADCGNFCFEGGFGEQQSSAPGSNQSGKSLLDLVFGLNRTCVKPSLLPLPDCQQDLITLNSPVPSKDDIFTSKTQKDADSQTTLSSRHLEQEMNLLHKAFLDQLAHFSVQLVDSCKTFGHSWQTSFLAELVDHFQTACSIIGESSCQAVPSSDRLDELQDVSNQISICLAKLRAQPHSFVGDCSDHDISTLLSSPPDQSDLGLVNTWV